MSPRSRFLRMLALCVAAAPIAFAESAAVATLLTDGYSSAGQTVSQLAAPGMPHPAIVNAGFVAYGVMMQPLGPLLLRAIGGLGGRLVWGLVVVYGGGAVLATVFTDQSTAVILGVTENVWHDVVGRVGFSAIMTMTLLVPYLLRRDPRWRGWRVFSLAMGVLTAALVVPFQADWWPGIAGVWQRAFFAATLLWVGVTAGRLFVLAGRGALDTAPARVAPSGTATPAGSAS
ncbi:MAG: DUF998 domain-containing protein [SAR202 cluster bacterium]|nr:DUF998 domain-containing protein [SAR202 cluster bacterium]